VKFCNLLPFFHTQDGISFTQVYLGSFQVFVGLYGNEPFQISILSFFRGSPFGQNQAPVLPARFLTKAENYPFCFQELIQLPQGFSLWKGSIGPLRIEKGLHLVGAYEEEIVPTKDFESSFEIFGENRHPKILFRILKLVTEMVFSQIGEFMVSFGKTRLAMGRILKTFLWGLAFLTIFPVLILASKLPTFKDLPHWQATAPEFLTYSGGMKAFYLHRTYQREDGAKLELFLAGGTEGARLIRTLKGRIEINTENYLLKYDKEGPYQTLLSFAPPEKRGFVAIFLKDDPPVILFARFSGLGLKEALGLLKSFDWNQLLSQSLAFLEGEVS